VPPAKCSRPLIIGSLPDSKIMFPTRRRGARRLRCGPNPVTLLKFVPGAAELYP